MLCSLDVGQPTHFCSLKKRLYVAIKMLMRMTMTMAISFAFSMTTMRQGVQQQVASPGSERSVGASADVGSICTLVVWVYPFYLGFNMYSRYSGCFGFVFEFHICSGKHSPGLE